MKMDINFTLSPKESDIAAIYNGLLKFNIATHFYDLDEKQFAIFIRSPAGEILGGLTGKLLYTTMQINYLWIATEFRCKGYGLALVSKAEEEAKKRKILNICLDTYSFQAPGFYIKLGFVEVGRYVDFPKAGIDKIFFQKKL